MAVKPSKNWKYRKSSIKEIIHPTNAEILASPEFRAVCERLEITPTKRQAAKYRNKMGRFKGKSEVALDNAG